MTRLPSPTLLILATALAGTGACAPEDGPIEQPPEVPADVAWCDDVGDWDPDWTAIEDEVVVLINDHRSKGAHCGDLLFPPVPPITMSPALRCAARKHAVDLAQNDYFSNIDSEDRSYVERAELAGYAGTALGQNLGSTNPTAASVVEASMSYRDLCAHIMNAAADEIGVGWADMPATFPRYWVQTFGASS